MRTNAENYGDRRLPGGGGFSLIELVVVLAMVAVLGGVAVAKLATLQTSRGAMAARELAHDLDYARQRSLATGARSWVVLDTVAKTWSVLGETLDNPGRANATVLTHPVTGKSYVVTLGVEPLLNVQFQTVNFDGQNEIGFDWLGRPLNKSATTLAAQGSVVFVGGATVNVAVGSGLVSLP